MRNLPEPLADMVPCKLYNEKIQATAASLGGIERGWLQMCLINTLPGVGREDGIPWGSLLVVFRKHDDSSALQFCKEEHLELVGVVIGLCLTQVV
jgi:hypothetical protein